ncbi:MAG TPA: ABC transporter substrate-binding protein [bacterium]|nr:ABC transporter substrate-binding protein [bacterium]
MKRDAITLFRGPLSRRGLLAGGAVLGLGAAGGAVLGLVPAAQAQAVTGVSEQLGWLVNAQMAGDFVAIGKGYFKDAGIDLKIQPGGPNIDPVQIVAGGGVPFGNVSSVAVLVNARSRGLPVKAFGAVLQRHPFAFMFFTKSGIRTPKDFEGKTIGIQATARPLLEAVLAKYHVPVDKVKVQFVGGDTRPLVTGQVDVITGWIIDAPQVEAVRQAGSYGYFKLWDLGIHLYAYTYFTTDRVLSERKDLLVRFLSASGRGWAYAAEHPDEAVDWVIKAAPALSRPLELQTWKNEIPYMSSEMTKQHGLGYMDPKVWKAISDTYYGLKQIPREIPPGEVMTNEIVDAAKTPKI